jgi:uncharacterized membrane protein YedE/YeeE
MEWFATRAPWYVAGPLLGLLVVVLLWVANRPLGATGGWIDLLAWLRKPSVGVRWTVFFLCGIVLGGLISAVVQGDLGIETGFGSFDQRFGTTFPTRAVMLALAGVIMGYGVRRAGGCTSGHGICGTSLGSRGSWVATVVFMTTAVASANLLAWLLRNPS